ncbi:MAG: TCR/Tet family MFS transporter [Reichenbachiella sp.]
MGSSKDNKATVGFIFFVMLIDVIGLGIIVPVIPNLIMDLTGEGNSAASVYGGWLMFSYAIMQFLFSPILGGLSDQYGRKPILLISLFGMGLNYMALVYAPDIAWLFIARALTGITGASTTTASAYIADISTPEKKAQNFGMIGAAFGLGFIIGPMIGGLLGEYGTRVPFMAAAGLSLVGGLYGTFILPESLSKENRRNFNIKRANPLAVFKNFKKYKGVGWIVIPFVFMYLAGHSTQSIWTYYTIELFQWTPKQIGWSLAFVGLMITIVQGGIIKHAIRIFGQKKSIFIGFFFSITGYYMLSFANEEWMVYAIIVPFSLGGLIVPGLQSIMSNKVPSNEQGELQGGLTSLISLTAIVGPPMMTAAFFLGTSDNPLDVYFPGASFFVAGGLVVISLFIALFALKKE